MSSKVTQVFTRFATDISRLTGRPLTFVACCALVIAWAASGPLFGFSDTWQLVINTSTTIVTFLMVFLIQNTQNRDNNALHAKLDELIRVTKAHNSFIGIENLPDEELEEILTELDEVSTRVREEAGTPTHQRSRRKAAKPASGSKGAPSGAARRPAPTRGNRAAAKRSHPAAKAK
ncbi:low affinity iron permease family protein [Phenylobacterium sp. LjRoot164]|uniref:low affinity iron permease family protein n=1 Tax=unclassified Phenylobacterium TaxID=2640670 RepID=UPI003ECE1326